MIINYEPLLDFDDVLIQPQRSRSASRQEVEVEREFRFYHSNQVWEGVPVMAANMDTTGTFEISEQLYFNRCITCLHKFYTKEEIYNKFLFYLGDLDYPYILDYVWVSVGIKQHDFEKIEFLFKNKIFCNLCVDVANGYTDDFVKVCRQYRELCEKYNTDSIIMAGNVCTPEMVQELVLHGGVDIVKVGIGPGSACSTRLKTGVGFPQLSAVINCSSAAHGLKRENKRLALICSDGGCRIPADISKAIGGGADFVMLGGMFAGCDESGGERINTLEGAKIAFYGMSSKEAQDKYSGGMSDYKASEGRCLYLEPKGPIQSIISDILGGIRSCCSYIGADSIKDMSKCTKFNVVRRIHSNPNL